ncbi:MAG TPA: hypothetical protein DCP55_00325 [Chitinophagaceae bacterium]|nr:hypothetical protein [Chitinophagaceae bacterium]
MIVKFYILGINRNFRGESLFQSLVKAGVNVEIVWGIDSKSFHISQKYIDNEKSMFFYGRELTASEIACTLGHKMIADKAIRDAVDYAIILEDDVVIRDVGMILKKLQLISSVKHASLYFLITHRRLSLRLPIPCAVDSRLGLQRIYSNAGGTVAYVLNKRALESLAILPIDTWAGVQADFPPIYFEKMYMYSIRGMQEAIGMNDVASIIEGRIKIELSAGEKIKKVIFRISLIWRSDKKRYGLGIKAYCAHFFGRALAWRLNSPVK